MTDYKTASITDPSELLSAEQLPVLIFNALEKERLTEREKRIIVLRYGLDGEKPNTLQQVGDLFGVTGETIRRIENKTLRKLKQSKKLQSDLGYLFDIEKKKRLQKKKNEERQSLLVQLDDAFRFLRQGWGIEQISFMTTVPEEQLRKWFYRNEGSE